jgi:hypothetical protein
MNAAKAAKSKFEPEGNTIDILIIVDPLIISLMPQLSAVVFDWMKASEQTPA